MKQLLIVASLAFAMMSCGGGNKTATEGQEAPENYNQEVKELTLNDGKWRLDDYAGESELAVMDSTQNYYLTFAADSLFGMETDCNSLGGQYKVNGDSLTFDNIAMTQMACPSEVVEKAMAALLPRIDTYAILPNGILQLRSDARTMAQFSHVDE